MPSKKYIVRLSEDERSELTRLVKTGKAAAYKRQRAQILLKADENNPGGHMQDKDIANSLDVGVATVERIRRRLVEKGFERVLEREPQSGSRRPRFDGEQEAQLIALSCSEPPEGHKRWTLKLLASQMVALEHVDSVSSETVRKALKKSSKTLAASRMVYSAGREC